MPHGTVELGTAPAADGSLLGEVGPARLVTHRFAFADAAEAYELLNRHPDEAVQVLLTYGD